jgi:parvulin-like peptidyl-prolyl isomerase
MRIFPFAIFLALAGTLSAQAPEPKPNTPAAVKPPAAVAPKKPAAAAKPPAAVAPKTPPVAAATSAPAQGFDKVVLSVGDEKMTVGEFEKFVEALPEQYRAAAKGPGKRQVAEQLVSLKTLAQEARKRKLEQDPLYKSQLAFQAENLLAGMLYRDLSTNLKLNEADVRKYYDDHKNEYEKVKARHILIRVKGSAAPPGGKKELTDEEALAKVQALRARLVAGEDFASIAKAESDDTGSGANGGDLDFFGHGQMVPPFEQAAFAAPVGQVTEPVKTQFGYHLILVEKHETKTFDEVRADIEKKIRPELAKKAVDDLRKQASVTIDESFFGPEQKQPAPPPAAK